MGQIPAVTNTDLIDYVKMQLNLKQSFELLKKEQEERQAIFPATSALDQSNYRVLRLLDTKLIGDLSTFKSQTLPTSDHISVI